LNYFSLLSLKSKKKKAHNFVAFLFEEAAVPLSIVKAADTYMSISIILFTAFIYEEL